MGVPASLGEGGTGASLVEISGFLLISRSKDLLLVRRLGEGGTGSSLVGISSFLLSIMLKELLLDTTGASLVGISSFLLSIMLKELLLDTTGSSLVGTSTFFLSISRSKELLRRMVLNDFGGGLGGSSRARSLRSMAARSLRSMACFERSADSSHDLAASSAHDESHSGEALDASTPDGILGESAGTRTAKTSPGISVCTPTSCCDATSRMFVFGSESKEQLLRRANPEFGELRRMVAFGVVRAALGGELRRMVALDGVCGEGDWLDDFTSLTCFERSVMCGDVLAVSGAHSGAASHASAAAGTIRNERAHAVLAAPMLAARSCRRFRRGIKHGRDTRCTSGSGQA